MGIMLVSQKTKSLMILKASMPQDVCITYDLDVTSV